MVKLREIASIINKLLDEYNEDEYPVIKASIRNSFLEIIKLFNGSKKKRRSKKGSRKRFFTDQSQLDMLMTFIIDGKKIPYIAKFFKCSERTVRREIDEDEETKKLYFLEVKSKEIVTN